MRRMVAIEEEPDPDPAWNHRDRLRLESLMPRFGYERSVEIVRSLPMVSRRGKRRPRPEQETSDA